MNTKDIYRNMYKNRLIFVELGNRYFHFLVFQQM